MSAVTRILCGRGRSEMEEMEARVRGFYASWGSTAKGEDDLRRIAWELVEGDGAGLDAFNSKLRKRFHGTCLLSSAVRPCPGTGHQHYIPGLPSCETDTTRLRAAPRRKSRQNVRKLHGGIPRHSASPLPSTTAFA